MGILQSYVNKKIKKYIHIFLQIPRISTKEENF